VVESSAVQMCAGKVAAVGGDARTALDVCRRAVETVESESRRQLKLGMSPPPCHTHTRLTAVFPGLPG